jgi:hypothetical protein
MFRSISPAILGALLLVVGIADNADAAKVKKVGKEFQVNSINARAQTSSAAATLKKGKFVVVWLSEDLSAGTDVYAQIFNKKGKKIGGQMSVNAYRPNDQWHPRVSAFKDGGFVVCWVSDEQDGYGSGIYCQRFNKKGKKAGSEFRANTYTKGDQFMAEVAVLKNGGFVVVWGSEDQDGSDGGTYAQVFNKKGRGIGGEMRVNGVTKQSQWYPHVAATPDGGFVVVYSSLGGSAALNNQTTDILLQRFNKKGKKVGSETRANSFRQTQLPRVAVLADGTIVVTWTTVKLKPSNNLYAGYGQLFTKKGKRSGKEISMTSTTKGDQGTPRTAALPDGGFAATWVDGTTSSDSSTFDIRGRRFNKKGKPVTKEFTANTYRSDAQSNPSLTAFENGQFAIFWQSLGQDGSDFGIFGQRFE